MLEKETKARSRKLVLFVLVATMCVGMCMTAYARITYGSVYGMPYVFTGYYSSEILGGTAQATIEKNSNSYVEVRFKEDGVCRGTNTVYGIHGTGVSLSRKIGKDTSGWRVYNSAKSWYSQKESAFATACTYY